MRVTRSVLCEPRIVSRATRTVLVGGVVAPQQLGALQQVGALEAAVVGDAVAREQLLQLLHVQRLQLLRRPHQLQGHVLRSRWICN